MVGNVINSGEFISQNSFFYMETAERPGVIQILAGRLAD